MGQKKKGKSPLLNILINLVIPIIVLTKFSGEGYLGAKLGLVVALIFPLLYGAWEFRTDKRINFFSGIGVSSVLLTGGIGLFELPNTWLAWKEASIPLVVGIVLLVSHKVGHPLLNGLLRESLDFEKIFKAAKEKGQEQGIEKGLKVSNYILACVFFASALANFVLAKLIVVSLPGTPAYNVELGTLTGLSFVVIVIPFLIAFILMVVFLIRDIKKKTGLKLEEIVM